MAGLHIYVSEVGQPVNLYNKEKVEFIVDRKILRANGSLLV